MVSGRVECMMALPPLPSKTRNPRSSHHSKEISASSVSTGVTTPMSNDHRMSSSSSSDESVSRAASSCEFISPALDDAEVSTIPLVSSLSSLAKDCEAPKQTRRRPQRPCYYTRASPTVDRTSLAEAQKTILDRAPQAEVVFVCIREDQAPPNSIVLSRSNSSDVTPQLKKADTVFLMVESSEDGLVAATNILRTIRANSLSAVAIAILLEPNPHDMKLAGHQLARLVHGGADDAVLLPGDANQLGSIVILSMGKAKAFRQRSGDMEKKICGSRKQCDQLFWQIAHEVVPEFPELKRGTREIDGKRAGNIELTGQIGEGAFAAVHAGRRPDGKTVAVKVIAKDKVKSIDRVLDMANEFNALQKLNHPNVVAGYSFVHCTHNLYIFMELCGTSSLFKLIEAQGEHGLSLEQAKPLMCQIADGIAYMHSMQIAHCDLKPENMALTLDGGIKIVDLGEAVDTSEEFAPLKHHKGTMPFMAPEVLLLHHEWKPLAVDLWSLGVILVEMLCGNNAFIRLLGWQGKDFKSHTDLKDCVGDLMHFFNTDAKAFVLSNFSEVFNPPQSAVIQLMVGLLELCPEKRLPSVNLAQFLH